MRKIFILAGSLCITFILVTRFVSIEVHKSTPAAPPIPCSIDNPSQAREFDFPIINRGFPCAKIAEIRKEYQITIKPILEQKCLMCHGIAKRVPLYAIIPPTSFLIKHDQYEAKKYMNMSFDFPFQGSGSPHDDLEKVREVITEDAMPPLRYRLMHWNSRLTHEEKKAILNWVDEGIKKLEQEE